jgi:hypothetical protein
MPDPGCGYAGENQNSCQPGPMPARLCADVVNGHHRPIRETSDFALTAVKDVNGLARHNLDRLPSKGEDET